ncbi:hypothetical protein JAAARDRAFT_166426 [Jaapia argillacea MUCL 33604]|uniref:Phosphatase n=1 Tax=Jaapia argillacea MUCL 33604 TaxID=933084 RepID=A0A067QB71_9AGAM|nr:hypothetical protein JAAARDRAFT_166426 [Jaapia argillacea MUCL 33604]
MPVHTITVDAILFDMDGTLVDSTQGVVGAWHTFAETYRDIDVKEILNTSHGVRTVDNLQKYCGITDPDELEREACRFEIEIVRNASKNGNKGIVLLPGVRDIMLELEPHRHLPNPSWAICTSATRDYASAAVNIAGVPVPDVFIAAEDVERGKPFPDPYLLGAKKLGVQPERCLVIEDAPAGIKSGKAAGSKTLALITSHTRAQMEECKPDFLVTNLASVVMRKVEGGIEVRMDVV